MSYVKYRAEINIPTLILHNPQMAAPGNPFKKELSAISGMRKKTDADHEKMALIEFEAGLYVDRHGEVILPGRLFEAMIAEGAKLSKEGKISLSSVVVENDARFDYDGGRLSVEELKKDRRFWSQELVRVGAAKIVRTRPIFENVNASFIIALDSSIAEAKALERWIVDGLSRKGLGDWRPRHGRGYLTAFSAAE